MARWLTHDDHGKQIYQSCSEKKGVFSLCLFSIYLHKVFSASRQ